MQILLTVDINLQISSLGLANDVGGHTAVQTCIMTVDSLQRQCDASGYLLDTKHGSEDRVSSYYLESGHS